MNIEEYIKNHEIIITITSVIIQALATIVLVFVTWIYTRSTKLIAELNKDEFTSNNRSFVFVSNFFIDENPPALRLTLENSGRLPAEIKINVLGIAFYDMQEDKGIKPKQEILSLLKERKYYVFPNQKNSQIGYPLSSDNLKEKIENNDGFFLNISLEYGEIGKELKRRTEMIVNFKTGRNSCEGVVHDIQTIFAN